MWFQSKLGRVQAHGTCPYGKPIFKDLILDSLIDLKEDGSFELNLEYFNYCQGLTMTNHRFAKIFDGPPRKPEDQITEREINLAASIQAVTEEIVIKMAIFAREETGKKNLCLSGGVALNCVANGKLQSKRYLKISGSNPPPEMPAVPSGLLCLLITSFLKRIGLLKRTIP